MLAEDYCLYEVSKLFREKGFSEKCVACYDWIDNSLRTIYHDTTGEVEPQDWNNLTFEEAGKIGLANWYRNISAPTHQMAMKWLRKIYGFHISVAPYLNNEGEVIWVWEIINIETATIIADSLDGDDFNSCEEAAEAALKYCLTELI